MMYTYYEHTNDVGTYNKHKDEMLLHNSMFYSTIIKHLLSMQVGNFL